MPEEKGRAHRRHVDSMAAKRKDESGRIKELAQARRARLNEIGEGINLVRGGEKRRANRKERSLGKRALALAVAATPLVPAAVEGGQAVSDALNERFDPKVEYVVDSEGNPLMVEYVADGDPTTKDRPGNLTDAVRLEAANSGVELSESQVNRAVYDNVQAGVGPGLMDGQRFSILDIANSEPVQEQGAPVVITGSGAQMPAEAPATQQDGQPIAPAPGS